MFDPKALSASADPAIVLSVGLPLIGVYLAKKKHDSPLARKVARFLGADVDSINERFVFDNLKREGEYYYNELAKNVLTVITGRGDISPLTKMLDLTEGEAWEIFNTMKDIIFSAEVLKQFSIIVPSLERIEKNVENVKSNLNSVLEAFKSPLKVSSDVDNLIAELRVHESANVSYVHRNEDSELEHAILNNDNKIILIIGGPGSGKSKMLYNALMYCKEYFSTFILIKSYFREGDEKGLDLALSDKDNFVIVWDDLHEKEGKFVSDILERINNIGRSKNFRFIGASRKDITFVREQEASYRINLHIFDNITQLVSECTKAFNVKLKPEVSTSKILSKGDGTPYYIISIFKMFKDRKITLEALNQLPSDVTSLWRNFIETTYQDLTIYADHLNAFRSIGLLSHASSEPSQITKDRIYGVYHSVFHGDLGRLDYALNNLVANMFVSWVDAGYYYAHDSHIEALETIYPLEKYHVQNFTMYEGDSKNLWTFSNWAFYKKEKIEYFDIISSRIIDIYPNDPHAWNSKGLALSSMGKHKQAIVCYDKALEIEPNYAGALNNKALSLSELGRYEEDIVCYDKAIEINPNDTRTWSNKGAALRILGRYNEALVCFDKVIELDPKDAGASNNKGLALRNLDNHEEAIKCYDKALEIEPNDDTAWYSRACSNIKLQNIEKGLADLKKAIEIDNKYIELARQDNDFRSMGNDERFRALVG